MVNIVGLDLGYFQTKLYTGNKKVKFLSVVGSPDVSRITGMDAERDQVIEINGESYLVGHAAAQKSRMKQRRENRGWYESNEYKVLFYRALASLRSGDYHVITGLPNDFFGDADRLKAVLEGQHSFRYNDLGVSYDITANVIMQPFGSLAYVAFDDQGLVRDNSVFELVGIIDIGGKTTNILTAQNFSDISPQTVSKDVGGWDIIRAVRSKLMEAYPEGSDWKDHLIAEAITKGYFYQFGERVYITDILDEVLPVFAEDIVSKASTLWDSAASLRKILVTGGGAKLIGEYITDEFPHAEVLDDPVYGNAIGYYRFGKAVE